MGKTSDSKLDPRFRALEAAPDPETGFTISGGAGGENVSGPGYRAFVLVAPGASLPSAAWTRPPVRLLDDTFLVQAAIDTLRSIALSPDVVYVEAPRPADIDLVDSVAATKADLNWAAAKGSLTGKEVIIGVVDYGFDFTLADFCSGGSTRALALWDQQLKPTGTETSPAGYGYGVEYKASDINAALATSTPHTTVRHTPSPSEHGTHVLGIAVGNGSSGPSPKTHIGVAYEADIVFVNPAQGALPLTSSDRIAEAIKYIFDQAKALKRAAVVNVSLGHNGAGHDGESVVERTIDRLLESEGRALVKSAGNEGEWQTHASGRIATGETFDLMWVAGGGLRTPASPHYLDRTPNTLEVWYSSRDRFRVRLADPSLLLTTDVDPGQQLQKVLSGHPIYIESERFHPLTGRARIFVRVGVDPATGYVATGTWRLSLVALDAIDEEFDAWIERDARDSGNNYADQSYFQISNLEKTISPPGTVRRGVAVGNYNHRSTPPKLAASSSRGPTADGRLKPEVSAPGVAISSSNAGGATSGAFRIVMTGTSMSAPHVTGVVAQLFQHKKTLTAAQVRAILIASARRPGTSAGSPFDPQWGYGAVDAEEAVQLIP